MKFGLPMTNGRFGRKRGALLEQVARFDRNLG